MQLLKEPEIDAMCATDAMYPPTHPAFGELWVLHGCCLLYDNYKVSIYPNWFMNLLFYHVVIPICKKWLCL